MIPTSWRKMSELTWKGPDDGCARVMTSMQSDHMTVRGFSAEVSGPLRATQQEAIRDAERAIWTFEQTPERSTADPVDSLAFAIYVHTSGGTLDDAGRARYRRAAEVALQIARGTEDATELRSQLSEATRHLAEVEKDRDEWKRTAKATDDGLTFNVNLRGRMLAAAGYDGTDLEAGVRHIETLKNDLKAARDRLAIDSRKIDQVEHERDEARREIRIAHEALDAANVPRMAGTLADRIRRLDERRELQHRDKLLARGERARAEAERDRLRDEVERLREQAKLPEQQRSPSDRDDPISDLIADYEARIGVLEALDQRRTHTLGILALELAEALGVKKVSS